MKFYEGYPDSITISSKSYPIHTDFREWIRLIDMVKDEDLDAMEKAECMMRWFTQEIPTDPLAAIESLARFMKCEDSETSNDVNNNSETESRQSFSYEYDADAIIAGFQQVYGIDLMSLDYMHWWHFKFLLEGLPGETEFKQRIYYRTVNLAEIKDDKERQRVAKMKLRFALPSEEIADEDIGSAFW